MESTVATMMARTTRPSSPSTGEGLEAAKGNDFETPVQVCGVAAAPAEFKKFVMQDAAIMNVNTRRALFSEVLNAALERGGWIMAATAVCIAAGNGNSGMSSARGIGVDVH